MINLWDLLQGRQAFWWLDLGRAKYLQWVQFVHIIP